MTDHFEEEAQLEQIKEWWQENYKTLIFSATLGLCIWGGWHSWQWYNHRQQLAGSADFAVLMKADKLTDLDHQLFQEMTGRPFSGVYPVVAQLKKAQLLVQSNDYDSAIEVLDQVLSSSMPSELEAMVRVRLARLFDQKNAYEAILKTLEPVHDSQWSAWADYLRSHAYHGLKQDEKASRLLEQSASQLQEDSLLRRLVVSELVQK